MRGWYISLCWVVLALLLAGCRQSGCEQGGDADQPPAKTLLQGATAPAVWRGLQPGSSSLSQVNDALSAMPDIQAGSIYNDHYSLSQGSFRHEVEKTYFNFALGNNQRQELFFEDGTLALVHFNASNVTLAQALKFYGEPQWLLSTSYCEPPGGLQSRYDQIDLLYPAQGVALKLFGIFADGIDLQERCNIGNIFLFAPEDYERMLLSQVAAGDYLDPQVAAGRLDELSQRMQAWQGLQPLTPYTPQPCPPKRR